MLLATLVAVFTAALTCALILATSELHIKHTGDCTNSSHRKLHKAVVPRIGGVSLLLGLMLSTVAVASFNPSLAVGLALLIACFLPVFLVGFAEDITKRIRAASRYSAAALSALLVSMTTDLRITHVDVWGFDGLLVFPVIGIIFYVFAVASVSHAFNLIDGQNGLCAGVTIICCAALGWQSHVYELAVPMTLAMICAAANLGFLLFNFPLGKIFLGDAGAYLNGSLVAVSTVMLIEGSGELSPWYAVALLIYPIWETFFSMWRRFKSGRSFFEPDSEHLHSLYYKAILKRGNSTLWTRSSAPAMWLLSAISVLASTLVAESTALCLMVIAAFGISYLLLYRHVKTTATNGL